MTVLAVPASVASLKGGSVSLIFHVPFVLAEEAFKIHGLQDKEVMLDVYLVPDQPEEE